MARVLVMTFKNESGQNVNVRLNYPRENLTSEEVDAVMDTIVAKNIFATTGGDLVEKVGAYIEELSRTSL